ncbi:hypothetical protein GLOTRDRAFT_120323, partial [Gloeophyllum trabeum ATCC 11539]
MSSSAAGSRRSPLLDMPTELFYIICRDVRADKEGLKALASLAQTCHKLSSPALDTLWEYMDRLEPLSRVAPKAGDNVTTWVEQVSPGQEAQLARFTEYASRIRVLTWDTLDGSLELVTRVPKRSLRPLLPGLQEVILDVPWTSQSTEDSSGERLHIILTFIVNPSLRVFRIGTIDLSEHVRETATAEGQQPPQGINIAGFMRFLHLEAPFLEVLHFTERIVCGPMHFISNFPRLRDLDVVDQDPSHLDGAVFRMLSENDRLRHAVLPLDNLKLRDVGADWRGFAGLKTLHFRCDDRLLLFQILAGLMSPHLAEISVDMGATTTFHDLHEICAALVRHKSTLRQLSLFYVTMETDESLSAMEFMEPLLELRKLRSITLASHSRYAATLTDADIEKLAAAWPRACLIDIPVIGPTVNCFVSFARHCPDLDSLGLVDITDEGFSELDIENIPSLGHPLRELGLACADIEDLEKLARAIDRIFPYIEYGYDHLPEELLASLHALQTSRESNADSSAML